MTPELRDMLLEGFHPPWMDKEVLALCLCLGDMTIDRYVAQGVLPPPRKRGGKLMWKWSEVDKRLTMGNDAGCPDIEAKEVHDATRRAIEAH